MSTEHYIPSDDERRHAMLRRDSARCLDCGGRNRASGDRCRHCQTNVRRMANEADKRGWTVDQAGGAWWVWNARGDVLGQGNRRNEALSKALGED